VSWPQSISPTLSTIQSPGALDEQQKQTVLALSQAVGALAGGLGDGGLAEASLGAMLAENSVKNNILGPKDRDRLRDLRERRAQGENLNQQEWTELVRLDAGDQMSAGLLRKIQAGVELTPVEQANWDIYYSTYVSQNGGGLTPGGQVTGQLSGTGPDTVIGFPYAGLSVDKHAYSDTNLTWFERYIYREKTSNESTYMEGLLRSGLESFRSEDYLPTNMAWRSFFAVQDAQINSALASAAYLAASASDMSEERRRSLTLTVGGLANLLENAATVKSGVAPVTGSLGIRKPPAATPSELEVPQTNALSLPPQNGGGLSDRIVVPTVTATTTIGGRTFVDYNQTAREFDQGNSGIPTLIADRVAARSERSGKVLPNGNMATAHAEIAVIQKVHDAGLAVGADMSISVSGKDVCGFCKGDIAAAAQAAGLNSLSVRAVDNKTGLPKTCYWTQGMRSIREKQS